MTSMTIIRYREVEHRFELRPSTLPNAGKGCFARVPMQVGDRMIVHGVLIDPDSETDHCTAYADQYKFRVGRSLLIPFGFGAMVNHSPTPNLRKVVVEECLFLEATCPIAPGDELFLCYSDYAIGRFFPPSPVTDSG